MLDDEVGAEAFFEAEGVVDDRNGNLTFDDEALFLKFVGQDAFVDGFEQARSEAGVDEDSGLEDLGGRLV